MSSSSVTRDSESSETGLTTLINGQRLEQVPASDRGLLFGDGLFETMAFWKGNCPLWDRHMARLMRGCRMLGIDSPDAGLLAAESQRLIADHERAVIRLTLTRGCGGRAYFPDPASNPRRILQLRPWPEGQGRFQKDGLQAIISSLRLSIQPGLSGLKHCNRLEQVLAARECQQKGADEALVFDQAGHLAEAISANLLIRINGRWLAPSSQAAVSGVGLDWLLANSPLRIAPTPVSMADVDRSDSILMINSVSGIRPLYELNGRKLLIDQECRRLQLHWNQELIPACDD